LSWYRLRRLSPSLLPIGGVGLRRLRLRRRHLLLRSLLPSRRKILPLRHDGTSAEDLDRSKLTSRNRTGPWKNLQPGEFR
jgi:hypothetical protein